jgi:hypothetical protein
MYAIRRWSVRHARGLARLYDLFEWLLVIIAPLLRRAEGAGVERPVALVERTVKRALFDCRMCGQCVLGETGMSCPMNCPKTLRNGPCGGVRPDGGCEVVPAMRCVWVEAWEGSRRLPEPDGILDVQTPVDNRRWGRSSWLAEARALGRKGE